MSTTSIYHTVDTANRDKNWDSIVDFLDKHNHNHIIFYTIKVIIEKTLPIEAIQNVIIAFNFDIHKHRDELIEHCFEWHNYLALEYFIESGLDIKSDIQNGRTSYNILKLAAENLNEDDAKIIPVLLKNHIDPNSDNGYAFITAVKLGIPKLVQIFIDYGIDVKYQIQALTIAIKKRYINIVKILIDAGISVNEITIDPKPIVNSDVNYLVDIGVDPIILSKMWY